MSFRKPLRILIISMTAISRSTATGSLLSDLFANEQPSNIMQITCSDIRDEESNKYTLKVIVKGCSNYLTRRSSLYSFYKNRLPSNYAAIMNKVQEFEPELIYLRIVDKPVSLNNLALIVQQELRVPLVLHVMDDYEMALANSTSFLDRHFYRKMFSKTVRALLQSSTLNLSISERMSEAFKVRYGHDFYPIHNGIDPDDWSDHPRFHAPGDGRSFRFVLAGALAKNKELDSAYTFANCVDLINRTTNYDIELLLNVQKSFLDVAQRWAGRFSGVTAQGFLNVSEYRDLLKTASCLVLCKNFDDKTKGYTELSFHNKLPEYLASGTPIMCFAPSWDQSSEYLVKNDYGCVVNKNSEQLLFERMIDLLENYVVFKDKALKARNACFTEFNINNIRSVFLEKLHAALKTNGPLESV